MNGNPRWLHGTLRWLHGTLRWLYGTLVWLNGNPDTINRALEMAGRVAVAFFGRAPTGAFWPNFALGFLKRFRHTRSRQLIKSRPLLIEDHGEWNHTARRGLEAR
jgi:hypothetical protein